MAFVIKIAVAGIVAVVAIGVAAWVYLDRWAERPGPDAAPIRIEVAAGASLRRIGRDLEDAGAIDSSFLFTWLARREGVAELIRVGEYEVPTTTTPADLLTRLVSGDVITYRVKFIEGWTVAQVLEALRQSPALTLTLDGASGDDVLARLGLGEGQAEGQFFPDTYQYERGQTDGDILVRAYVAMRAELAALWSARAVGLPYETPNEALIMASIIEKETGLGSDRNKISGVFVRRLQRGIRLQTDPSVIYGLGAAFDGNLTRAHLGRDGPYNTYTRRGLPPSPICLPGRDSINAALHPEEGAALYFVARGDGSSQFSETLQEHHAAVRRYQLGRN